MSTVLTRLPLTTTSRRRVWAAAGGAILRGQSVKTRPVIAAAVACRKSLRLAMMRAPSLGRMGGVALSLAARFTATHDRPAASPAHDALAVSHDSNIVGAPEGSQNAIAAKGRQRPAADQLGGARVAALKLRSLARPLRRFSSATARCRVRRRQSRCA